MKLADVLWEAANVHLEATYGYSCFAVDDACDLVRPGLWESVRDFLNALGCETGTVMNEFSIGPERQGVRYMWLLLAMHVAEDEGIEVQP